MNCRKRIFKTDQNRYGYLVATLDINGEDDWKCGFAKCYDCGLKFVAVRPKGVKTYPCPDCLHDIRVK